MKTSKKVLLHRLTLLVILLVILSLVLIWIDPVTESINNNFKKSIDSSLQSNPNIDFGSTRNNNSSNNAHSNNNSSNSIRPVKSVSDEKLSKIFERSANIRVYEGDVLTIENNSIEQISQTISDFHPSYVSGIILLDGALNLSQEQVIAFNKIRTIIQNNNPDTKFDIVIDLRKYDSLQSITPLMADINSKIRIDAWLIQYPDIIYPTNPSIVQSAIDYAHSNNQFIGATLNDSKLINGIDYIALTDGYGLDQLHTQLGLITDKSAINILLYINNDDGLMNRNMAETFIDRWDNEQRTDYITYLSQNQKGWGYTLIYPIFYPLSTQKISYDINKDSGSSEKYSQLMKEYN